MKKNQDDLSDDELFASYEAYKALLDAGLSKDQALSRTGLTAQIVKDFEDEDDADDDDFKSEFEDMWEDDEEDDGNFDPDDDSDWKEEDLNEGEWEDQDDFGATWDEKY